MPRLYRCYVASLSNDFTKAFSWELFVAANTPRQAKRLADQATKGYRPIDETRTLVIKAECLKGAASIMSRTDLGPH